MSYLHIRNLLCALIGFSVCSLIFLLIRETHNINKHRLQMRCPAEQPQTASPKVIERKKPVALTDKDILNDDDIRERILYSMKLYREKMKLLKNKKMTKTMRKRPVCTNSSNPSAWCHDKDCKYHLSPPGSPKSLVSITKPIRAINTGVLDRIPEVFDNDVIEPRKYVFLLAITENHYIESQATIQTLHEKVFPHIRNYTFFCYDMGLTKEQIYMLRTYGKATVRRFPFHLLPERIHMFKNFTWKAVLIQAHIDKAEFVVYADASVRFTRNLLPMFERAKYTGFLMSPGFHGLAQQTSLKMFKYYGDHACAYSSYVEYEGGFLVFRNEPFARTLLLEPWVACALDPNCMSDSKSLIGCPNVRKYGKCHRADLSAMTIILVKLFGDNMTTFDSPRRVNHYIRQGRVNVTNYLKNVEKRMKKVPLR